MSNGEPRGSWWEDAQDEAIKGAEARYNREHAAGGGAGGGWCPLIIVGLGGASLAVGYLLLTIGNVVLAVIT